MSMIDGTLIFIIVIIAFALIFDFTNGFHDAANSVATVVSTRVLTPKQAVIWAAFFNFIAFMIFGTAVAKTIGKGMIDINQVDLYVILAGILGTIAWNITTWYLGLPTSSSHALIGGYAGAAIAKAGFGAILWAGWIKTVIFIVGPGACNCPKGKGTELQFILKSVDGPGIGYPWIDPAAQP